MTLNRLEPLPWTPQWNIRNDKIVCSSRFHIYLTNERLHRTLINRKHTLNAPDNGGGGGGRSGKQLCPLRRSKTDPIIFLNFHLFLAKHEEIQINKCRIRYFFACILFIGKIFTHSNTIQFVWFSHVRIDDEND